MSVFPHQFASFSPKAPPLTAKSLSDRLKELISDLRAESSTHTDASGILEIQSESEQHSDDRLSQMDENVEAKSAEKGKRVQKNERTLPCSRITTDYGHEASSSAQ